MFSPESLSVQNSDDSRAIVSPSVALERAPKGTIQYFTAEITGLKRDRELTIDYDVKASSVPQLTDRAALAPSVIITPTLFDAPAKALFLVPTSRLDRILLHIDVPASWTTAVPSGQDGRAYSFGNGQTDAIEALLSQTIVCGRLRTVLVSHSRPPRMYYSDEVEPDTMLTSFATRLDASLQRLLTSAHLSVGDPYSVVFIRESHHAPGQGARAWPQGQIVVLNTLTARTVIDLARQVLSSARHSLGVTTQKDETHSWLSLAADRWSTFVCARECGLISFDELEQELRFDVYTLPTSDSDPFSVDRYAKESDRSHQIVSGIVGSWLLQTLADRLGPGERGESQVEAAISAASVEPTTKRAVTTFWRCLAMTGEVEREYTDRYINGSSIAELLAATARRDSLKPIPLHESGSIRSGYVAYSAKMEGFLETCGCKVNESGGVARRSTLIQQWRRWHPGLLLVDAGSTFLRDEAGAPPDSLDAKLLRLYLQSVATMGYDASAVGFSELAFGSRWYQDGRSAARIPYTVANVLVGDHPIAAPWIRTNWAGFETAVVGLFERPHGFDGELMTGGALAQVEVLDPLHVCDSLLRGMPWAQVVIIIGRLSPDVATTLLRREPRIALIVSSEGNIFALAKDSNTRLASRARDGMLRDQGVVYENYGMHGLELAKVDLSKSGRVVGLSVEGKMLDEHVRSDPAVRGLLTSFYERAQPDSEQIERIPVRMSWNMETPGAAYVGAEACKQCHLSEYVQWRNTRHADAYKTLLDVRRHFQPECVSCHVVGFKQRTGFRVGDDSARLGGVQCEVCHGPGNVHVAARGYGPIGKRVSAEVCLKCHDPEHSSSFDYASMREHILHK